MSGEKKSWPKLRSPFRRTVPHETSRKRSDTLGNSKISNTTLSSVIVPVFEVEPRKTSQHVTHTENVRSFSTEESCVSHPQNSLASHGDSYDSSWSAQTSCTTPGANLGSFSGQAVLPAGKCSPRISGDLEGRLGNAYRHIQNMPPSPISPTISQLTGDPRTYHKQLGVPQHSVINQPTLEMPSLPNPYAAHARSRSQPLPSSFPFESLPTSWTWDDAPEPSSAPRFRHVQIKAQYHQPQIDINDHPNNRRSTTTSVHSSQTSPPMILGPVKPIRRCRRTVIAAVRGWPYYIRASPTKEVKVDQATTSSTVACFKSIPIVILHYLGGDPYRRGWPYHQIPASKEVKVDQAALAGPPCPKFTPLIIILHRVRGD
ncbi:uncharacterized protein BJ212DRAFT_288678 [Suillus subaureus]|uniref:Uncharacterized protein n=1 Tax=Suillus subaureus TaxID=48587 RepID=A0A9P7EM75_9AGAM|nr:uncharacterized protein BJ212DRAFT_288678 [Suillus subaureus]KAG1825648.1 hypothetical protein BJ212DRAFT_288678 [Suillus subaureus]